MEFSRGERVVCPRFKLEKTNYSQAFIISSLAGESKKKGFAGRLITQRTLRRLEFRFFSPLTPAFASSQAGRMNCDKIVASLLDGVLVRVRALDLPGAKEALRLTN